MKKVNIRKKLSCDVYDAISECMYVAELSGIKIYLVGGIVRDILLSKPLHDVDITVEGNAKEFVEILECYVKTKAVKYNEKLPTAKVVFKNGVEIDFASTRKEVYDNFGDLPKIVAIGCALEEDIKRRDFTVNSLVISLNRDDRFELKDLTNGVEDLKNKKLRVLHEKSFFDDPSRMIRGLKFAQRLGFELDDTTKKLQDKYLENPLVNIPLERVKNEIIDLFSLNFASNFDKFIEQGLYKIFDIDFVENIRGFELKSALFEYKIQGKDIWKLYFFPIFASSQIPQKLNLTVRDKKIIENLQEIIKNKPNFENNFEIFEYFSNKDYLSVVFYGIFVDEKIAKKFFKIKNTKVEITGFDLQKEGIPQGKIYSEIQTAILKEKLNNGLFGKEQELNFVRKYYKN